MRRAQRLFDIIQHLRRRKLIRASDLAERLEVSERTIYRDIAELMASGVPVEGAPGLGYALRGGYDLPPLMFDSQEIEALTLGARIVESWSDPALAESAAQALAKIEAVLPDHLRRQLAETALLAPKRHHSESLSIDPAELRRALRHRLKVAFRYRDGKESESERQVWPLGLSFYGPVWVLAAWCELRQDFRSFRLDRMDELVLPGEKFKPERGKMLGDYLARQLAA
ncbi:MAG TPA: YafY family protein [Dongiaceae bacterium]|jgi:predicted DNA-binding transcriptional regulator YafY|nr:YafY family protein [Dongiaceae bacterium]